jgi:hypothetical protein
VSEAAQPHLIPEEVFTSVEQWSSFRLRAKALQYLQRAEESKENAYSALQVAYAQVYADLSTARAVDDLYYLLRDTDRSGGRY